MRNAPTSICHDWRPIGWLFVNASRFDKATRNQRPIQLKVSRVRNFLLRDLSARSVPHDLHSRPTRNATAPHTAKSLTTDNYFYSSRGRVKYSLLFPFPGLCVHLHACTRNTTKAGWNVNRRNYRPTTTLCMFRTSFHPALPPSPFHLPLSLSLFCISFPPVFSEHPSSL